MGRKLLPIENFIICFCKKNNLKLAEKAFRWSKILHAGQIRDDGSEYITHPIKVFLMLISVGIVNDIILASALLHDVIEETAITKKDLEELFGKDVADVVTLLSKKKPISSHRYYFQIGKDIRAILIKSADRMCNIADIVDIYTKERMERYVRETEKYILKMLEKSSLKKSKYNIAIAFFHDYIKVVMRADKKVIALLEENIFLKLENAKLKKALTRLRK